MPSNKEVEQSVSTYLRGELELYLKEINEGECLGLTAHNIYQGKIDCPHGRQATPPVVTFPEYTFL